jgi:histidinol dehydrogenase
MRILTLSTRTAERLLAARGKRNREAERIAARIVTDVRRRGDTALRVWSRNLDGTAFTSERDIWMKPREFHTARRAAGPVLLGAIEHAARNIRCVAEQQKPQRWSLEVEPGVRVGQIVRPLGVVGCYVPGGRFALVSTLLMTAIPAQVAGVRRIVVACPHPSAAVLAAASMLGLHEVACVGGAQAIAALAYGTRAVPRVDKICGPGNRFVTAAKRLVSHDCAIDMLAGPTELLILARQGKPAFIAADLLAQAEHDPDAITLLVTTSRALARAVRGEVSRQLSELPASNLAARSLVRNGCILLAKNLGQAIRFANRFAPEHLSLPRGERGLLEKLEAAGSVLLGPWSGQPLGDYASGSNHVLPTSGWARARGGLSVADFVKCVSVQEVSRGGLRRLATTAKTLAEAEGLAAHRRAVEMRE